MKKQLPLRGGSQLKNKILGHIGTILTHKKWVFYYCRKAEIPWQGLIHDLSKFSPTEFLESIKYWTGTRSPIDECKAANNGVSAAWLHHKGHNKHHCEYWNDVVPLRMPKKYLTELICDYFAASRAYLGKDFSYQKENEWWKKQRPIKQMHESDKKILDFVFEKFAASYNPATEEALLKEIIEQAYLFSAK